MKNLLIFGSDGFLAKNLRGVIEKKKCVYNALGKADLDLTNALHCKNFLKKIDTKDLTLIFLSALRPSLGDGIDLSIKNLHMINNVILNVNINLIRQFIYISSDGVYPYDKKKITENTFVSPETLYGSMHYMRELYIKSIVPKEKLTILRPCAMYGNGETIFNYGINKFIRDANQKKTIYLFGKGEEKRDHILVDDVSNIIYQSFKNRITGTFNLATGESKSFMEIAQNIKAIFNSSIDIVCQPRVVEIKHRAFNTDKIIKNFKMIRVKNINDGLRDILKR